MKLQNFDVDDFLQNYWQQKPLLIRNAFENFESVITPEELAGLSCEDDVFSRLVIEKDGAKPWQLVQGPFCEKDFLNLPETHYSLLVSECDKWIPELQPILDQFTFIPQWRIDDLMISYAPKHGSVGPHIDQYDVFLIQAHGQRRWQIQNIQSMDDTIIDDLDLAILKNFEADEDWILNPGDILYLPPGVPHFGVAQDRCMTYSIGFRAPSAEETIQGVAKTLSSHDIITDHHRYSDKHLEIREHNAEIKMSDVENFQNLIEQAINASCTPLPLIMGELMTQKVLDKALVANEVFEFSENTALFKHPDALFAYFKQDNLNQVIFFANGQSYRMDEKYLSTIQFLSEHKEFIVEEIPNFSAEPITELLSELFRRSIFIIEHEH